MKAAKEKWIPCTSMFPDYEICLGPFIAIRRNNTSRGSFTGKRIAIQHYRNEFWATLYNRHGEAKRVNIVDMAKFANVAEWKRKGGKAQPKGKSEPARVPVAVSKPVRVPEPPKPTREQLLRYLEEVERSQCADSVKRRQIREIREQLAVLDGEGELKLQHTTSI
jgi:hypothetical protein